MDVVAVHDKRRTEAQLDAPDMDALGFPTWNSSTHNVAGLPRRPVVPKLFGARLMPDRKPAGIRPALLPGAMPRGADVEWSDGSNQQPIRRGRSHTGRIQPVAFGQTAPRAIVLCAPAGADLHGHPRGLQPPIQRPARAVDRRRVLQRLFRQRLKPGKPELRRRLRVLALVAGTAREREVAHAVGATAAARRQVFDLQWYIRHATVGAAAPPLVEQILAHFVARQFALLVVHTADFRVLHEVRIKLDHLDADRADRCPPSQPLNPRQRGQHPMVEARGYPTVRTPPIAEARLSVAGRALASAAAYRVPRQQGVADLLAPMGEVGGPDDLPRRVVHQRDTSGLRAGIEFEAQRFRLGCSCLLQDDGERKSPPHGSLSA